MDVTYFLAQSFGLLFLIGGIGMILKKSSLRRLITRFSSDREVLMMGGFISLVIGIPLILIHNLWGSTLESIVSIVVWLTFLKGVVLVLLPDRMVKILEGFASNMGMVHAMLWLMVILGGYLIYAGFGL